MKNTDPNALHFFLGGYDLEMEAIAELLRQYRTQDFADLHLPWGARASTYARSIEECVARGKRPVLVELANDLSHVIPGLIEVEHHGARAGANAATSLEQVFGLLQLPRAAWTREHSLIAANDRAWIPGMLALGASAVEIAAIRARDRAAQGIRASEDQAALAALAGLRHLDSAGRLAVVDLPHGKTAVITDRLHPIFGAPQPEILWVRSPNETNIFGPGWAIDWFDQAFPGGWFGGALPITGYWGRAGTIALSDAQIAGLLQADLGDLDTKLCEA